MTISTLDKYIEATPNIVGGKPRITGHRITVQNIVIWYERMGKSVDEISVDYGLTLSEIHAALTYYFDHQDEIKKSIRESEDFIREMQDKNESTLEKKLSLRCHE